MKRPLPSLPLTAALVLFCALVAYPDGRIDGGDLLNVAENWQRGGGGAGDLNGDGIVDEADVLYIIEHWKQATSPTPTFTFTPSPTGTATPTPTNTPTWTDAPGSTPTPSPTAEPSEIIIDIPGLPADATPLIMVRIPAGSFMMGHYAGEILGASNEEPQHRVDIGHDFYIGKYEITKAQWQAVMGAAPWQGQAVHVLHDPNSPAICLSWYRVHGTNGFLYKLNLLGSGKFRLPSEAEWEYACRAGTTTRYYWGDDSAGTQIGNYAWYYWNAWKAGESYAHVVGLKLANAWGLHDMSGNVWEWCEDWWNESYQGAPADGSAWTSGDSGYRVRRGGDFAVSDYICRSAHRDYDSPARGGEFSGLRIVREVESAPARVDSVSVDSFSPSTTWQGGRVSNDGALFGSGSGPVEYHWVTLRDGILQHDSGPFIVPMVDGEALILPYNSFPTGEPGSYEAFVRVTSQTPYVKSQHASYTVASGSQEEIIIDLPGLPQDATPLMLVKIPAGRFTMGHGPDEGGGYPSEDPRHRVDIGYDFYLGKHEITKAQWEAVMGTAPWLGRDGVLSDPDSPAVHVSWNDIRDATGFLERLNALGQGSFRLPSEAEWEYACRATSITSYYWGDDLSETKINDFAWYRDNTTLVGEPYGHVVGLKLPNGWGLHDMSGNVAEWCEDWRNRDYVGAPVDGSAWTTGDPSYHQIRGGAWGFYASGCRSAGRGVGYTTYGRDYTGFRVVRTVESATPPTLTPTLTWTATPTYTHTPTPTPTFGLEEMSVSNLHSPANCPS
ncbi:formylglycine-generating enzyme family protein [bacterium]|nr:formylglycine-generating enzyme family protein [bacterium]